MRCYGEHVEEHIGNLGNILRTHWELIGNLSGTTENEKNPQLPLKRGKKKHLECMLGPSGWLHETSYSKRICHNFWLGQCPLLRTEYLGIHVHDIFTSIQIKFNIDKNNNQQLKTIWELI